MRTSSIAAACGLLLATTAAGACRGGNAPAVDGAANRPAAPDVAVLLPPRPSSAPAPRRPPPSAAVTAVPPARPDPAPREASFGPQGELMRAGNRVVTTAELGEFVLRWQPEAARTALGRLTLEALVLHEAARESVEPPAEAVTAAAGRAFDERMRRLRLEHGARADVAAILRRDYGRTEESLRADLGHAVRIDLLHERLTRLDALRRDGIEVRILVLPGEGEARAAAAQWREGADGAVIARKFGVTGPDAPPAIQPDDVPDPRLRERLVTAAPGTVLDPVPFEAADAARAASSSTWWQVFKVVRSWKASTAPWRDLAAGIEASLRDAPPREDELAAWQARAARRAGLSWWDGAKGFGAPPPGK